MSTPSAARIAANRANAQNSTGPRTLEGKARVSENAMKHGLRSERNPLDLATDACLPAERAEFQATLKAFLQDLAPQDSFQTRLVERLAQIDLRLNRALRMETTHLEMHTGLLTQSMGSALPLDEQTQHSWLTTLAFLKNPSATTLIQQYESRLSRDFARTLAQLRQSQKLRNQTQPEMPAHNATPGPCTIPTRSHPSDGVVASLPPTTNTAHTGPPSQIATSPKNLANQTQPVPEIIESTAYSTAAPSASIAS